MTGFGDTPPNLHRPGFGTPPHGDGDTLAPPGESDAPALLGESDAPAPRGESDAPAAPGESNDLAPRGGNDAPASPAESDDPAPRGGGDAPSPAPPGGDAQRDSPATHARITVRVNGRSHSAHVEARTLLSDFLRHQLGLTGTKVGCEHGVCGACTVQLDGEPVRACLTFAIQADRAQIKTIEGLEHGPLQDAFHEQHALQCGFCTAGILLTLDAFLKAEPEPTDAQLEDALAGNLCRCTGYAPIIRAVRQR